jgi:hypothetical protein
MSKCTLSQPLARPWWLARSENRDRERPSTDPRTQMTNHDLAYSHALMANMDHPRRYFATVILLILPSTMVTTRGNAERQQLAVATFPARPSGRCTGIGRPHSRSRPILQVRLATVFCPRYDLTKTRDNLIADTAVRTPPLAAAELNALSAAPYSQAKVTEQRRSDTIEAYESQWVIQRVKRRAHSKNPIFPSVFRRVRVLSRAPRPRSEAVRPSLLRFTADAGSGGEMQFAALAETPLRRRIAINAVIDYNDGIQ